MRAVLEQPFFLVKLVLILSVSAAADASPERYAAGFGRRTRLGSGTRPAIEYYIAAEAGLSFGLSAFVEAFSEVAIIIVVMFFIEVRLSTAIEFI
ncbi:MAG: hypothetical protein PHC84_05145 [Clostridia bacterium]|nr:hypothetical protein [Clostridia bacterium]